MIRSCDVFRNAISRKIISWPYRYRSFKDLIRHIIRKTNEFVHTRYKYGSFTFNQNSRSANHFIFTRRNFLSGNIVNFHMKRSIFLQISTRLNLFCCRQHFDSRYNINTHIHSAIQRLDKTLHHIFHTTGFRRCGITIIFHIAYHYIQWYRFVSSCSHIYILNILFAPCQQK